MQRERAARRRALRPGTHPVPHFRRGLAAARRRAWPGSTCRFKPGVLYADSCATAGGTRVFRSLGLWLRYLNLAYPAKPADYTGYMTALAAELREPGRMAALMKTFNSPADAAAQLPNVKCPALVIMGTLDPDFADPQAEGDAVIAAMPAGMGTVAMVDGAGHYPHAQCPDEIAALVIPFLKEHAGASGMADPTTS